MHTSRVSSPRYSASRVVFCLETASLYSSPTRLTRLLPQLIFHCATVFYAPRRHSRLLARRPHSPTTLDSPRARLAASCASLSGGGSRSHHEARRAKESRVKEVVVKVPVPASPNPSPNFNMDELAKLIKEAVQASTRELVGSYALGPGPALGQPPQAPLIESYVVSFSQSTGRPPFQGRGHLYGGPRGSHQQSGGHQQSGQQ
jgi:hypothetical protein